MILFLSQKLHEKRFLKTYPESTSILSILFNFSLVTHHKSHTNVKGGCFVHPHHMPTLSRNCFFLNRQKKPFRLYFEVVVFQHLTASLSTQVGFKAMLWRGGIETIINFERQKKFYNDFALWKENEHRSIILSFTGASYEVYTQRYYC